MSGAIRNIPGGPRFGTESPDEKNISKNFAETGKQLFFGTLAREQGDLSRSSRDSRPPRRGGNNTSFFPGVRV